MPQVDVIKAFEPAWNHMVRLLFRPFALRKWFALGLTSTFAAYGSYNYHFNLPSSGEHTHSLPGTGEFVLQWMRQHWAMLILAAVLIFLLSLVLVWIGSVLKFVYLNQITRNPSAIKEPFARYQPEGLSYFLWMIGFGLIYTIILGVLIALPLLAVFLFVPDSGTAAKVIAVIWAVIAGLPLIIAGSVISIFAEDFVLPVMYIQRMKVLEAWRTFFPMLVRNAGQFAIYVLLLIPIGIALAIAAMAALAITGLILALPTIILALGGWAIWAASGSWSIPLIIYIAVFGFIWVVAFGYVMNCTLQPAAVFRRAYPLVILGQADAGYETIPN